MKRRTFLGAAAAAAATALVYSRSVGVAESASAATATVDFNNYPLVYSHLDWQLLNMHSLNSGVVTGFNYESGSGAGQRLDQHGVTWPTTSYYDTVLGTGGYNTVNAWPMSALTVYAQENGGNWESNGWNRYQDLAEGAACVDDSARTAIAMATDYLRNGTATSLARARALLTFTCYMTTMEGKVYNFAWGDAPTMFAWDPIQSQDAHFMYRSEFYRRTQYPPLDSGGGHSQWMIFESDTSNIILNPTPAFDPTLAKTDSYVRASPFVTHPKYSIYMDDLQATNGADVATVYNGPLYNSISGSPSGYVSGIKKDWSTSNLNLGGKDARQLWALALGLQMMQKVKSLSPGGVFDADSLAFAKFLENHLNRVLRNVVQYDMTTLDNRLASNFLVAFCEYYRIMYVGGPYGTYSPNLPQSGASAGGSTSSYDDPISQSTLYSKIDEAINSITARQFQTTDWRNGIFIDDSTAGNWQAWGQLQIYALAKAYKLKRDMGQSAAALDGLLTIVTYSADTFYANQAYHYNDSSNNYARTKERITSITAWAAKFHTNDTQSVYQDSSIVAGLIELAEAYYMSGRTDAAQRLTDYLSYAKTVATWFLGNNNVLQPMYGGASGSGAYDGQGQVFDQIQIDASGNPYRKNDAGGESSAEGLWAMILIKDAISTYSLSSTFSFNY